VFGRVIDGFHVIDEMEKISNDAHDRPQQMVRIESVIVHANPIAELEADQN
jgi:peptidyl-prolyl cis-trans isomerase-like 3